MKRLNKILFFIFMFMPIMIFASTFNRGKEIANNYYKGLNNSSRYLVITSDKYEYSDKSFKTNTLFKTGGFVSKYEFLITTKNNSASYSYLYDGNKYWTLTTDNNSAFLVSENSDLVNKSLNYNSKITEYVKENTIVSGKGTYEEPWYFNETHKVTLKSNNKGYILNESNKVYSLSKEVADGKSITFNFEADSGYKYLSNDCGEDATIKNGKLVINNVSKDIECSITFGGNAYVLNIDTPTIGNNAPYNGHTTPSPEKIYLEYNEGFFKDATLKNRITKLDKVTYRSGCEFYGWYLTKENLHDEVDIENQRIIDANGNFTENYTLINNSNTKDNEITLYGHWKDIEPPKCNLKVVNKKVIFEYKTDNVGVTEYGISTSTTAVYNSQSSVNANVGKYYGYVRDEQGNTASCCVTVLNVQSYACNPYGCYPYACNCYSYSNVCGVTSWGCGEYSSGTCSPLTAPRFCSGYACNTCWNTCWNTCYSCDSGYTNDSNAFCYKSSNSETNKCDTVNKNTYTLKFDQQGSTTKGTESIKIDVTNGVVSRSDNSEIVLPKKAGYVFGGYYTSKNGEGNKIFNVDYTYDSSYDKSKTDYGATERSNLIKNMTLSLNNTNIKDYNTISDNSTTVYAYWIACNEGNYCPGDNKEYSCVAGTYTNEKAQSTCKKCAKGYSSALGGKSCEKCPIGYYNEIEGGTCKKCAEGYSSPEGSTSKSACENEAPTCDFTVSNNKITINTSDNVKVSGYGISTKLAGIDDNINDLIDNNKSISYSSGTYYGYVIDNANIAGTCKIEIKDSSNYCSTYKSCATEGCGVDHYTCYTSPSGYGSCGCSATNYVGLADTGSNKVYSRSCSGYDSCACSGGEEWTTGSCKNVSCSIGTPSGSSCVYNSDTYCSGGSVTYKTCAHKDCGCETWKKVCDNGYTITKDNKHCYKQ